MSRPLILRTKSEQELWTTVYVVALPNNESDAGAAYNADRAVDRLRERMPAEIPSGWYEFTPLDDA